MSSIRLGGSPVPIAWDTTAVAHLARPGPARALAIERLGNLDPIGIPAPCLLELAFGYRRALERGDGRFSASLAWVRNELHAEQLGVMLPMNEAAATVAGEIRALRPFPSSQRARGRSKAEARASWLLDIEIAATAWVAGFDLATANRADFDGIADTLNGLAPGAPPFVVVDAEA